MTQNRTPSRLARKDARLEAFLCAFLDSSQYIRFCTWDSMYPRMDDMLAYDVKNTRVFLSTELHRSAMVFSRRFFMPGSFFRSCHLVVRSGV